MNFIRPSNERGVRYYDLHFNLKWPLAPTIISDKDQGHRTFDRAWHLGGGR
jgi:dTDP-4-dehydrorhamnose 3,5-epimerase